jgi:hypothetical protein
MFANKKKQTLGRTDIWRFSTLLLAAAVGVV